MTQEGKPPFIYKDKKGNEFYRADWHPEKLPSFHKSLMRFHIFYLFFLPSAAVFLNEMYFEGSGAFRLIGWLVLTIYVSFLINNYKMPVAKGKAAWEVFAVPVQILIVSFIFQWGLFFEIIEWAYIELVGFSVGLTIGTLFRQAPIGLLHRFVSFLLAIGFAYCVSLEFQDFLYTSYENRSSFRFYALAVPFATAIINNVVLFTRSEFGGEHDVNLGNSTLSEKLSPLVAFFAVFWLLLPSIGKAFS